MKTLKEVPVGSTVRVKKVGGTGPVRRRIMDMGITKGVEILRPQGGALRRSDRADGAGL